MSKLEELMRELCPEGVEYKPLKSISIMQRGTAVTKKDVTIGEIPVISGGKEPAYYCSISNRDGETITVAGSGAGAGFVNYWTIPIFVADAFSIKGTESVDTRYLYHCLLNIQDKIYATQKGGGVPHVHISSIENLRVPIPPIPVQQEIVRILDNFTELTVELTAELTARRKQYEYYRDKLLSFDNLLGGATSDVAWRTLESVIVSLNTGLNPRRFFTLNTDDAENYYVTIRELQNNRVVFNEKTDRINDEALRLCNNRSNLEAGDVLFSGTGTIGEVALVESTPENWNIKEGVYTIKPNPQMLDSKYLMYLLRTKPIRTAFLQKSAGGTVKSVPMGEMRKLVIPLPSLDVQKAKVAILDRFDTLCNDLSSGLPAEIAARQKQYEYYRDKLLSFEHAEAGE